MVASQLNYQIILLLKRPLTHYWTSPLTIFITKSQPLQPWNVIFTTAIWDYRDITKVIELFRYHIGISANFLPYRYRPMLFENFYQYRYKKEEETNEVLGKGWKVNTKDFLYF